MKKRILSLTLAATVALSMTIPAFASDVVDELESGSYTSSLESEGSVAYVNLEIISVVLPTGEAYGFTLDPLGLASLANGDTVLVDELKGNAIIGKAPVAFVNNSSVPVKIDASFTINGLSGTDSIAVATVEAVEEDTKNNVLLYARPSKGNMVTGDNFVESTGIIPLKTGAATKFTFAFPKATYAVRNNNGTYVAEQIANSGHGNAIVLAGLMNKTADWTEFIESDTMGLDVDFEITQLTDTTYATAISTANTTAPGYGNYTANSVLAVTDATDLAAGDPDKYMGPSAALTTGITDGVVSGTTVVITPSLGVGDVKATAVDTATSRVEVIIGSKYVTETVANLVSSGLATYASNKLTLKAEFFALGMNADTEVRVIFGFTGSDRKPMVSFRTKPAA